MDTANNSACPHCFGDLTSTPCPHCGWQSGADNPPPALALGTLLDGRYRIGRVLGHGGFGITYLARDENLQLRLAIKEYLPRDCATRAPDGVSLAIYSGQAGEQFAYGLDRFLDEARSLARFDQHPGIVTVKSFFRAHGTGYCVMDYVEGLTLRQYLERQPGGRIPVAQAWRLLQPVMDALRAVHKEGLLHRDLAPDNIYITRDGRVKLLDFGAARFAAGEHSRSLSIILKPGYAPEEQYRSRGKQGPWTDVYGLAATLYRAITGNVPPEALDRLDQDELALPSLLGIDIASDQERILLKALAVKSGDRYPTIAVWHDEWAHRAAKQPSKISEPPIIPDSHEAAQPSGGRRIARSVLIVAILGGVGIVVIVGSMWWKEQIERPFLLPDADIEQPMAVEQAAETPAQTETESPPNEKPLETVSNADTGEVIEQPAAEPMLPSLSDPVTLPYSPAEEAVGAFRPSVEPSPDSSATVQGNAESHQAVLGNTNTKIRASDSSATTVGISIYYAADTPPESNIPPESPLCYRFQVSGLEEQLSKLKGKYQDLYGDEIMADGFGGKALIAKRKDASGREVNYFYSTSPKACDDYQNRNRTTRIILSPVGEIGITINEHGAILEYDADRLYLGKDCDAYSARYGNGSWIWSNAGFRVEFQDKTYGFPRMDSPLDQPNCMLSYDSGRF